MKMWRIVSGILLLCLLLSGAAACAGGGDGDQANIQMVKVARGDITLSATGSGRLETSREVSLAFGSGGTVDQVHVAEGEHVTQGQELARLDTTLLEQSIETAQQSVDAAQQAVTTAQQSVTTAELTVQAREQSVTAAKLTLKAGELAVTAAEIDMELARNSYYQLITPYPYTTLTFALPDSLAAVRDAQQQIKKAQEELRKANAGEDFSLSEITNNLNLAKENLTDAENKLAYGLGEGSKPPNINYWTLRNTQLQADKAQIAYDKALNDIENLKNNVAVAENALENAKNNLEIAKTNVATSKTNLAKAKNELDRFRDELEKAVIEAPFDGIVAMVGAREGDTVPSPTMSPRTIIHLIDASIMELVVEVDEIDMPGVRLNQKAVISVDALPDAEFEGTVTAVYPLPKTVGGVVLYNVKISLDITENTELKAGMSASADIIIEEHNDTLLVPSRAVKEDEQGKTFVKVLVNGQAEPRPVVTGLDDGIQTEIVQGVNEGETVIIELRTQQQADGGMFGF